MRKHLNFVVRVEESPNYDNYSGSIRISSLGTFFSYLRKKREIKYIFLVLVWMVGGWNK